MSETQVFFKANAGIKNIIGKGLILDDNIAIIELIKNSKDARSPKVKINFTEEKVETKKEEGTDKTKKTDVTRIEPVLIITDYGKGMGIDDIKKKWLNIAFSEKKHETDNKGRVFAGSKGVGRFSCDRLGRELDLYTKSSKGDYIKLPINWVLFEGNSQDEEISSIPLDYEILSKEDFLKEVGETKFTTGTVLKIKNLRSTWEEKKLKKLISELEKFVSAPDSEFKVYLASSYGKEVQIKNHIYDELPFRTYNIVSSISENGEELKTTLYYHGEALYEYVAENPYPYLKNISINIHYLSPAVKAFFKRKTGYTTNDYGSIFLFYNGFRISPFGNQKNDWLGLDQRKSQGTARYFGTREVLGKINISDYNDTFLPISSREGMVQNEAFRDLTAYDHEHKTILKSGKLEFGYVPHIIRQMEKIIVGGLDWGRIIDLELPTPPPGTKRKVISERQLKEDPARYAIKQVDPSLLKEVIEKVISTTNFKVSTFSINSKLINKINKESEDAYNEYIFSFIHNTTGKKFEDLKPNDKHSFRKIAEDNMRAIKAEKLAKLKAEKERLRAEDAENKAKEEKQRADEAEKKAKEEKQRADEAEKRTKEAEREAEEARKRERASEGRSLINEKMADPKKTLDALITHVMKQISGGIEKDIKSTLRLYYKDEKAISKERLVDTLEEVAIDIATIKETATLAPWADFNIKVGTVKSDLYQYIEDYIQKIAKNKNKWGVKLVFNNPDGIKKITAINPAEINVFFTNALDNSYKAGATEFVINCRANSIDFSDNGCGFDLKTFSESDYLKKGLSTKNEGSGLGLYHCKIIAEAVKGKLNILNNSNEAGATLRITFNEN